MAKKEQEVQEQQMVVAEQQPVAENALQIAGTIDANGDFNITTTFTDTTSIMFSTIQNPNNDRAISIKVYNAMNNPTARLKELGKNDVINMTDFIAHPITLVDDKTGEITNTIRTVIIDENGDSYHAVSTGVVSALQKIIGIVGQGPWTPPLKIAQRQITTRKGFTTTSLELVL